MTSTTSVIAAKMCGSPAGTPGSVPVQAPGVWPPRTRSPSRAHGAVLRAGRSDREAIGPGSVGHQSTPSCRSDDETGALGAERAREPPHPRGPIGRRLRRRSEAVYRRMGQPDHADRPGVRSE
ncbi:hypothetical protein [Cryptosporangium phraense]|uniref:Uncharacterized protein n=1 Tax=Cryptosporangium phraense TaxID=2593070 RepID=A0A545AXQ4_9ACTN|nr:hypothetical protein [Cryptosporangium phraense]TQS46117.1 hypothetical protein FL583_06450 [Cryptosporangium phraense]